MLFGLPPLGLLSMLVYAGCHRTATNNSLMLWPVATLRSPSTHAGEAGYLPSNQSFFLPFFFLAFRKCTCIHRTVDCFLIVEIWLNGTRRVPPSRPRCAPVVPPSLYSALGMSRFLSNSGKDLLRLLLWMSGRGRPRLCSMNGPRVRMSPSTVTEFVRVLRRAEQSKTIMSRYA